MALVKMKPTLARQMLEKAAKEHPLTESLSPVESAAVSAALESVETTDEAWELLEGGIGSNQYQEKPGGKGNGGKSAVQSWADKRFLNPEHAKAFTEWFGDSKVTNENGEPLAVHHGTVRSFNEFDTNSEMQLGAHFGTRDVANVVTGDRSGGAVMSAYLSLKNPLRLPDLTEWSPESMRDGVLKATGHDIGGVKTAAQVKRNLQKLGYDGVVYLNRSEVAAPGEMAIPPSRFANITTAIVNSPDAEYLKHFPMATDSYIAFHPNQIKSATGNRGTFGATGKVTESMNQSEYCHSCRTALTEWETGPLCEGCGQSQPSLTLVESAAVSAALESVETTDEARQVLESLREYP